MSAYLSAILGSNAVSLSRTLSILEKATMQQSLDVRLTAEIRGTVRGKMKDLDLDPVDTTALELYCALRVRVANDDVALRQALAIKDDTPSDEIMATVAAFVTASDIVPLVWSLKRPVLKKLLAQHVPHKTMKSLHYRSEASMYKRESPALIYATALLVEGKSYRTKILSAMRKLQPADFEMRQTEIIVMPLKKWQTVSTHLKRNVAPIYALTEVNAVMVLPVTTKRQSCLTLLALALLATELRRLKMNASYIKMYSPSSDIQRLFKDIVTKEQIDITTVQDTVVAWRHAYRILAENQHLAEDLGPHLNEEDMTWLSMESFLAFISPQLGFWVGSEYAAFVSQSHTVSLHIIDMAFNELYNLPIESSSKTFVGESLYDEIIHRYMSQPNLTEVVTSRLQKNNAHLPQILYD